VTLRRPALLPGAHIRAIAPSRSLSVVAPSVERRSFEHLTELGFRVSLGAAVRKSGFLDTAPAADRLSDLHEAFADPAVDAILSIVGGSRCIDLLAEIDWDLVAANPKPLCGYSDVTVLLNAVYRRTGMVTFCGPHFSSFAMDDPGSYQSQAFVEVLTGQEAQLKPSATWSDDEWYRDGGSREYRPNEGWSALRPGAATGRLVGGNLSCFMALLGTEYAPDLRETIVLLEDTAALAAWQWYRALVSLTQHPGFDGVRGIVLGRFQRASNVDRSVLVDMLGSLPPSLLRLPILADVELGHTQPIATFPIGARADLLVADQSSLTLAPA
jgi:muramoyltetrapeptide carboxypeptidase